MFRYILLSGVYRFFCGAIILAINWNLATGDNGNFLSLAIAITISFIPAVFVPILFRQLFNKFQGPILTAVSLIGVVASCLLLSNFYSSSSALIAINFLIWIFFFVMETSWETWFAGLAKNYSEHDISRYSSISMTVNQVALMSGPLAAPVIIESLSYRMFFLLMGLTFLFISLFSSLQKVPREVHSVAKDKEISARNYSFFIALVLIWPILGSVNFMLPVHVTIHNGDMINVGILDAFISIGMAIIGVAFSIIRINSLKLKVGLSFSAILVGFAIWWVSGYSIIENSLAIMFLGFGFGGLRIMVRYVLARNYSTKQVATLVSRANALSLPILGAVLGSVLFNIDITWILPFVLSIFMAVFLIVGLVFEQEKSSTATIKQNKRA